MIIKGGDVGSAPGAPIASHPRAGGVRASHAPHPIVATALVALLGYLVLAAAAVGAGLLLTRELLHGVLGDWDADVTTWLVERRTPWRDDLSSVGSGLSETLVVVCVMTVVLGLLALRRHWRLVGLLTVAMAVEVATYASATYFVERHRPRVPRLEQLVVADSYFSGHVAAAVAMYGCLAIIVWSLTGNSSLRGLVLILAVGAPIAVALSRMYRGMHYASDVTVGALVGLGCIAVGLLAVRAGAGAAERRAAVATPPAEPLPVDARPLVTGGKR